MQITVCGKDADGNDRSILLVSPLQVVPGAFERFVQFLIGTQADKLRDFEPSFLMFQCDGESMPDDEDEEPEPLSAVIYIFKDATIRPGINVTSRW
jgi:hypothetical protein